MTTSLRQTPPLTIDYRALDALALDPTNPRTHSKTQIGQIAKSIRSFGFGVPILVDAKDKVLCGHGRIEAARLIGLESVPVVSLAHLTAAEAKAFQIADNRLTELGRLERGAAGADPACAIGAGPQLRPGRHRLPASRDRPEDFGPEPGGR